MHGIVTIFFDKQIYLCDEKKHIQNESIAAYIKIKTTLVSLYESLANTMQPEYMVIAALIWHIHLPMYTMCLTLVFMRIQTKS